MTENFISGLQWRQKSVDSVNDNYHPLPQLTIYSDACANGWGATCGNHSTKGNWSKEESSLHIKLLEMAAVFFAAQFMQQHYQRHQYILG